MADSANLGKHFDDYVDELVKSGRYETRDDVLREGLRLIEVRERRLAELDAELAQGIADVKQDGSIPRTKSWNSLKRNTRP